MKQRYRILCHYCKRPKGWSDFPDTIKYCTSCLSKKGK